MSVRIRDTEVGSDEFQGRVHLGSRLLQCGRSEMQRDSEPQEAFLKLESGEAQEICRLPKADLIGEIGVQGFGVRVALPLPVGDGTLSEGLKKAKVQGIQHHNLLMPGTLDNGEFPVLNTVDDLLGLLSQIGL